MSAPESLFVSDVHNKTSPPQEAEVEGRRRRRGTRSQESEDRDGRDSGSKAREPPTGAQSGHVLVIAW